ncbi:hypothetical protein GTZ99_01815 [Novosphingobium sp. FSY-8]|uniref:Uncharacterized protein n=1 Tax=Novosphingobium ovatum TaxID=1908523 RepID=A0ABW9X9T1_9SPHN|nr:hypothetical protein [Novosphingobium ovatum]NBC35291.1 hypothetical protein [Novosphingobium ovatum]
MPLISLVAAAAAATAPLPSTQDRALFAAFRQVCGQVRDYAHMAATARGAGWSAVPEDAHPRLATLIARGRDAAMKDAPEATFASAQYTRTVAGRVLWLVQSRYVDQGRTAAPGLWANGCRVYDFDAAAPIASRQLARLIGKRHTGTLPLPDGGTQYLWEPGFHSGHSVEVSFLRGDDAVSASFALRGLVLTTQAIGGHVS